MTDDEILDAILAREGGYVDHPQDAGRCTNHGITLATLSAWRGHAVTCDDVKNLQDSEAREIYRQHYIAPLDGMPNEVRHQAIDIAVNSGVGTARALVSRAYANKRSRPVQVQLVIERLRFYARLVKRKPSQSVFLEGWINRAVGFL